MKEFIKDLYSAITELFVRLFKDAIPVLAAIALILPDILVRSAIRTPLFEEPFFSIIPLIFTVCWVTVFVALCMFLPRKAGRFVFLGLGIVILTLAFSNFVYYKIFNQFFWLSSIGLVGEAGNYASYAFEYVDAPLLITTLIDLALMIFVAVKWPALKRNRRSRFILLIFIVPVLVIILLHICLQPAVAKVGVDDWDSWKKPQVVYKEFTDANKSLSISGLYHFVSRDFFRTLFPHRKFNRKEYGEVDEFFSSLPKPCKNEYTDIFKGKNVIAVMLESFDDWLIDDTYTPVVNYMIKNGISFTDYYAPPIGSARTFNTEFAFNTGYYTPKSSPSAVSFSKNIFPYSLPNLFREKGYSVNSFHYNEPEFYNRGIMHKSFGYERYHSFMDYTDDPVSVQADSNIIRNDAIYEAMTAAQPFFNFVITYSAHIPYTYDDTKLLIAKNNHPELIDPGMDTETNNLKVLAADTDDFFRQLLTRLHEDGILENTVIIGFSDHYAYGFSDREKLAEYSEGLWERVPAFIYSPGIDPVEVSKPVQTADLLPTIVNLFGLENRNCYIGQDVFDERHDGFVHFEHSVWYDGDIYFEPDKTPVAPENRDYVRKQTGRATELIRINDIVVSGDYFRIRQ